MNRSVLPPRPIAPRPSVRLAVTLMAAVWLGLVAPALLASASANTPLGWDKPPPVNFWHAVLLLGGIPLALFVIITLLVMAPGWASSERAGQTGGGEAESWFGGPKQSSKEIEGASASPAGAPTSTSGSEKGGAGGRW